MRKIRMKSNLGFTRFQQFVVIVKSTSGLPSWQTDQGRLQEGYVYDDTSAKRIVLDLGCVIRKRVAADCVQ